MKNGRRSSKRVSNAVRFTTAGSTSTCPKSGFTVASSVMFDVSRYFRSTPTSAKWSEPLRYGLANVTPLGATLVLSATDTNLPISVAFSGQPDPQAKIWEPLKAERAWQWSPMQPRRVYLWFRDANGNERGPFVAGPEMWRAFLPRIAR